MPAVKPRIYVSVSPEVHKSLSRIARARALPLASVVTDILEEMGPALEQIAHMTELARVQEDALPLSGKLQLNIDGQKIAEAADTAMKHLDRMHSNLAGDVSRWARAGRSATAAGGCESVPGALSNPLGLNKGVNFRGEGGSKGKTVSLKDWKK